LVSAGTVVVYTPGTREELAVCYSFSARPIVLPASRSEKLNIKTLA
jgi:hypothetical protein